jgi:hypothetical protein
MRSAALLALAAAGCLDYDALHSASDLAGADLAGADLSMPGGVQLIESSCPIDLPNGRCYWDTPPDSFY